LKPAQALSIVGRMGRQHFDKMKTTRLLELNKQR